MWLIASQLNSLIEHLKVNKDSIQIQNHIFFLEEDVFKLKARYHFNHTIRAEIFKN